MAPRVGILLGRDSASAVMAAEGRRGPPRVLARAEAPVDPAAWGVAPERIGATFRALARGLPSAARRIDRPLMVALPDPVATEDRLSFREVPRDRGELLELVRFRVARDHRREPEALSCAAEPLGGGEVLVRVLPRPLMRAVEEGAFAAGFVPRRIEGWASYAIEHASRRGGGDAGAWLWSDETAWVLMCWAGLGRAGGGKADGPLPGAAAATSEPAVGPGPGPPGGAAGRADTHLHAEWRRPGDGAALAGKAARIAKSFAIRCGAGRLPLVLDLPGAAEVARAIDADPILEVAPSRRLPDPALCVALP